MNVTTVALTYSVTRIVEICHADPMTDAEIEKKAMEEDTNTDIPLAAPVLFIRRILKNSPCAVISIEREQV